MLKSVIVWKDNIPRVETRDVFPVQQINTVTQAILAEPYNDPLEIYPEYKGMSKGEVVLRQLINRAMDGEDIATRELLDRLLGKPKIQVETKRLDLTYQDYLDELERNSKSPSSTLAE